MCHTKYMRKTLIFLACTAAFSQAPGTLDPSKEPQAVIRENVNVVIAPTTVRDRSGSLVDGLQLQDFQLYDNNKLQRITADVRDEQLSLVVAVQRSSNLNEALPKIQRIGPLLSALVAGEGSEVAVVSFDHRIEVVQDFTNEATKINQAMQKLTPGSSNHAVMDAVSTSVRLLQKRPSDHRKVLLLISEKRDRGSELHLRDALEQAQFANIVIYSLDISTMVAALTDKGMPPPPPPIPVTAQHMPAGAAVTPTTVDQNYYMGNYIPVFVDIFKAVKSVFVDDTLDVFTRYTGGKEFSFISDRSLERAVTEIGEELHSQYLLSYSPSNQNEGGFHEIKVVVNRSGLEIRTRPGYWVAARPN